MDNSLSSISQSCLLSDDKEPYFNPDCEILSINGQCIYEPKVYSPAAYEPLPSGQIEELLSYIPNNYGWNERLPINFAVLNEMGEAGIQVLLNHWTTDNRSKLEKDLRSQLKSAEFGNIGTLVNEAKKHGYKPVAPRTIPKLKAEPIDNPFKPLLTTEEAGTKLETIIKSFFDTGKSTFINVSTGYGKTQTTLEILRQIPWHKRVLIMIPTHKLADEIINKYKHALQPAVANGKSLTQFEKMMKRRGGPRELVHIKGRKLLCENTTVLQRYDEEGLSIPSSYCLHECSKYAVSGCRYIEQFNKYYTLRIMTHNELLNEQSAWFYGNTGWDGSAPKGGSVKPDYIIVDEDWMESNNYYASLENEYDSIRHVISDVIDGEDLPEVINKYKVEVFLDYEKAEDIQYTPFDNIEQHIADCKKKNAQRGNYEILKAFYNYILSDDDSELSRMKLYKKKLHYFRMKKVSERYEDVPTLFLDATADKGIVKEVIGDVDFHSIKVKAKSDINVYQAENFNITKNWLEKNKENPRQLVGALLKFNDKYEKVGLITYNKFKGQKNFDKWLSDKTGIELYGHFGDIRGRDEFEDVDCLLIVGRHLIPQYEIQNYGAAIFGENIDREQYSLDAPIRMKDGSAVSIKNSLYADNRLEMVGKHFCRSETIQAIGRGRLIWGKKKDIFLFSKESMGGDVEIKKFFRLEDIFKKQKKYADAIRYLKSVGYCKNKTTDLHNLGLTVSSVNKKRDDIESEFLASGIQKLTVTTKDKYRKEKTNEYYVWNSDSLEHHITESGETVVKLR